jgi:hypothetical protein
MKNHRAAGAAGLERDGDRLREGNGERLVAVASIGRGDEYQLLRGYGEGRDRSSPLWRARDVLEKELVLFVEGDRLDHDQAIATAEDIDDALTNPEGERDARVRADGEHCVVLLGERLAHDPNRCLRGRRQLQHRFTPGPLADRRAARSARH